MLISHYPERRQRLNGDQQLTAQRFKPEEMIVCWFKFTERWEPAQLWTITHSFSFYISNVLWQPKLIWNMKHVRLSVWGFITCMCVFAAAELLSRRLSVSVSSDRTQVSSSAQLRLFFCSEVSGARRTGFTAEDRLWPDRANRNWRLRGGGGITLWRRWRAERRRRLQGQTPGH